mgnify:CR=1 FL=1
MSEVKEDSPNTVTKEDIISSIQDNMHRDDFAAYMNFCVCKWKQLEAVQQVIDAIMDSVCKQWEISKKELLDSKYSEPRAMMFYVIKKQTKLSYTEIGDMFDKERSFIHKLVNDMTFMIEKHGRKNFIVKLESIQKDLSLKNIYPPSEEVKKNEKN